MVNVPETPYNQLVEQRNKLMFADLGSSEERDYGSIEQKPIAQNSQ